MQQILQFLKEVQVEFKNIAWPKRDSLIQLTFVVISISIIISLILGGADFVFTQGINQIGQPQASSTQPAVAPILTIAPTPQVASVATATPKIIKKK